MARGPQIIVSTAIVLELASTIAPILRTSRAFDQKRPFYLQSYPRIAFSLAALARSADHRGRIVRHLANDRILVTLREVREAFSRSGNRPRRCLLSSRNKVATREFSPRVALSRAERPDCNRETWTDRGFLDRVRRVRASSSWNRQW